MKSIALEGDSAGRVLLAAVADSGVLGLSAGGVDAGEHIPGRLSGGTDTPVRGKYGFGHRSGDS
ncbi:hypothetical protein ACL02S_03225 [Nocardia sp. 004]|uniref:hypothetical protein n=1 Tax=Nocardia sp. 004 TaxID=3385978 RepID=UPI0039A2C480